MAEYNQRRGMGYRYSQDPAQQDYQEELKYRYAALPAQRALATQQEQFAQNLQLQKDSAATQADQYAKNLQFQKDNAATQQEQYGTGLAEQQRVSGMNNQMQNKALEQQDTASKYALGGNLLAALPAAYGYGTQQGWWGTDPNKAQKELASTQNRWLQQQMNDRITNNTTKNDPAFQGSYQQSSYFDGPRQTEYQTPGEFYSQATPINYVSGINYDAPVYSANSWDGGYSASSYFAPSYNYAPPQQSGGGGGGFWDNFGFGDGGFSYSF